MFLEAFANADGGALTEATRRETRAVQTGQLRPRFGPGWQREPGSFGRTCSAETFGHFESTGTLAWHDPATTTLVSLSTRPAGESPATLLRSAAEIIGRARA